MTAADITWTTPLGHLWLADTDALSNPAPAPDAEPVPIYDAAKAAHLAAGGRPIEAAGPFAAHVCGTCGATGAEPCRTPSGKVLRRFHVARG